MHNIIHKGVIEKDRWPHGHIKSLTDWITLPHKSGTAVQLEQEEPPTPLLEFLDVIELIAINFENFMDGRGFSYARELRELGYKGELRATGVFLIDQSHYLQRCGFDSFEFPEGTNLEDALLQLNPFDEHYQGAIDNPAPLFNRRS
jgi:uncharacterized protein (DUF934 family)